MPAALVEFRAVIFNEDIGESINGSQRCAQVV